MAESSSTSASTSTAANSDYDVFVNHRGPDVKKNFASHLYRRLISHGLKVFLDQPELQRGDGLTRQIEGAIRSASVHVAIFSSRYAESAWCLKELVLMRESNSPIIPVFYHAKPSDLLAIKGRYARALEDLKMKTASDPRTGEVNPRYDSNTIEKWRTALSSVKEIVGFDLKACDSDEGELLDKVVEGVLRKVKKPALDVAKHPTGLDDKITEFENTVLLPLQQSRKPQILGIVGLGGVGKTTLAKEFFNRKNSDYSRSCFLFDVRDYARKGTLNLVQRNLLKCLTESDDPVDSVAEGIARLRKHLSSANALVIIDDVDHEDQVDALLPHQSVLHSNSLILITSRNKSVLTRRVENTSIYKLTGLNTPHAEELFCCYAFNQPHPFPGFESLVNKFLETCDGLPLSLKVFGALLYRKYDKCDWQYLLDKLEVPSEIQDKLKISFDSLTKTEQKIFLDMACFFIGEDRDMAIKIWEGSGWNGLRDFQNIQDKCLVEVDSENKIKMHDHLRDLGRDLAKAPGLPRRLWSWKENDIEDLLQQSWNGQIPVRGIRLVSSEYNDIHVEDALGRICMRSLQLLDGEGVLVERILTKVPNLIWLRWKNCPCSSLPSSISMKNLRVLHLEGERLRTLWQNESQAPLKLRELEIMSYRLNIPNSVWKFPKSIGKLKHLERIVIRQSWPRGSGLPLNIIKLSEEFCLLGSLKVLISWLPMESLPECFGNLTKLHHIVLNLSGLERLPESFSNLTNLHRIELSECHRLKSLPESFGKLTNLHRIELSECHRLKSLPESFGMLTNLHRIELYECHRLKSLPESFGNLINLHRIELSEFFSLQSLPESFGNLTNLHHIQLSDCRALERLPDSFVKLINLKHLNLFGQVAHQRSHGQLCLGDTYLKELPSAIGELSDLEVLEVEGLLLDTLPPSLCDLKNLKLLSIGGCKELKCLPASLGLLTQLTQLTVVHCPLIRELPFTGERDSSIHNCILPGLRSLSVNGTGISEVSFAEGVCCNLRSLLIYGCNNVVEVGTLPNTLRNLRIISCDNLRKIDKIHGLAKLQLLDVSSCTELEELPRFETLVSLSSLSVSGCVKLKELPRIETLVSLRSLVVNGCLKLKELPRIETLVSLSTLNVSGCVKLPRIETLVSLSGLYASGCVKLKELPRIETLVSLSTLNVNGCVKLKELPRIETLVSLSSLYVVGCVKLKELPRIETLVSLSGLYASGCVKLKELPRIETLVSLRDLNVSGCVKLKELPRIETLVSLRTLNVSGCVKLTELPRIETLVSLSGLYASGCVKLNSIRGLGQLTNLRHLFVTECSELEEVEGIQDCTSLLSINAIGCPKLQWSAEVVEQLKQRCGSWLCL